jgi:signal transduction histidine kinase
MNRTQAMSLIVGGVIAVILGMIFQRGLTKPIQKLKNYMAAFSFKDSQQELKIKTGDEIEELAECFSAMVQKLKSYDVQQKRFLQNTSHELKTPLMSIQGYAEAIKDGIVEGNEMYESLDVIIDESKRLKKIVDEMIYLIKLDNVEETFHFETTRIGEIIDQSVRSVKALLDAGGIKLKIEGDCSLEGHFDKEKLTRAFVNILSNGIRYAESEITIDWKAKGSYIEINIADDGKGFQNGEENKVFERFYKGENGGTGIGLAITKAILTGHNSQIEAFNAIPKGAAFRIRLPRT